MIQNKWIFVAGCLVSLWTTEPLLAKDKKSNGADKKDKQEVATTAPVSATPHTSSPDGHKNPWVGVSVTFSAPEKEVIREYVQVHSEGGKGKKSKGLPPGLAKKVARGGELPPGWQKKLVRGEILSEAVFKKCSPLPQAIIVKLPSPPVGTILVSIEGKVVRLAKATREILDVFDVR